MSADDAEIVDHVRKTIVHHHCEISSGSEVRSGSLSTSVREAIGACDVAVCVATTRAEFRLGDGTFAIPPWIQQEMAFADGCQLKIIPVLEDGVRATDLKIPGDSVYIRFDRTKPVDLVHAVSGAISDIQRPAPYMNPIITGIMEGRYIERWGQEVGELVEAAMICIKQQRYRQAQNLLVDALRLNPDCWTAYINLGVSNVEIGEPEAARAWYNHVLDRCHDPKFLARAYHNIGALRESLEPHDDKHLARERLEIFMKALSLEPGRVNSMYSVFLSHVMLEDFSSAERIFWQSMQHEGFLEHFQRLMSTESADIIRRIAKGLDVKILDLAFPKRMDKRRKRGQDPKEDSKP
jgi:hypothetical protein